MSPTRTSAKDTRPLGLGRGLLMMMAPLLAVALTIGVMQDPVTTLGLVGAALVGALILRWPDAATLLVILILYTNAAAVAVKFHGAPSIVAKAFPALLAFPLLGYLWVRRADLRLPRGFPVLVALVLLQLTSALLSDMPDVAIENLSTSMVEGVLLYLLVINLVRTPRMLRAAVMTLLLAGMIMGGIPLLQQLTGQFDDDFGGFAQTNERGFRTGEETFEGEVRQKRQAGSIGEKNRYAQIMLMLVPLGMFTLWSERSLTARLFILVATGVTAAGATLSFSRGAAVGFVFTILFAVVMGYFTRSQIMLMVLGVALILAAMPQYLNRLVTLNEAIAVAFDHQSASQVEDGALRGRATEMGAAALVFLDHPVIGVGPGMFKFYSREYGERIGLRALEGNREAHSLFLGWAAELGFLGPALFLTLIGMTLADLGRTRRRWFEERPDVADMATGFLLALVCYLAVGFFLHFSFVRYFWLMLGLATCATLVTQDSTRLAQVHEAPERARHV